MGAVQTLNLYMKHAHSTRYTYIHHIIICFENMKNQYENIFDSIQLPYTLAIDAVFDIHKNICGTQIQTAALWKTLVFHAGAAYTLDSRARLSKHTLVERVRRI